MQIIKESLKGEHSFRGCGLVKIDGLYYGVLGSKRFNFGNGQRAEYCVEQLKRVEAEENRQGCALVNVNTAAANTGDVLLNSANENGRVFLHMGELDNHPLGGEYGAIDATIVNLHPAFELIGRTAANVQYISSILDTATISAAIEASSSFLLRLKPE